MIVISAALTLLLVPVFAKLAIKLGVVDRPDGILKTHGREVPYLGGLAMFFGALPILWRDSSVLLASSLAVSIGLMDDVFSLSPKLRLALETLVAVLIGLRFTGISDPIFFVVMLVGIVALINAVNMVDGMDGMAAGSITVSSSFLLLVSENDVSRELSLVLLVISLSFLVYNFPPAKVFMGDAGSYLLGTILSAILASSMRYGWSVRSFYYLFPVWIYAVDLLCGFIRRIRAGRSPFEGDRDHFYDKIKRRVGSDVRTLLVSYTLVFLFSMAVALKPFPIALLYEILVTVVFIWKLNLLNYDA